MTTPEAREKSQMAYQEQRAEARRKRGHSEDTTSVNIPAKEGIILQRRSWNSWLSGVWVRIKKLWRS